MRVRVVLGPQLELFPPGEIERFLHESFRVGPTSDRTGCRLEGPRLAARESEITTDGMVPGSIQVPPDGKPIVMLADGPTSGGYPEDRDRGHRRPRQARPARARRGKVRFSAVSVEEAQRGSRAARP